jgi:hypothetical protein
MADVLNERPNFEAAAWLLTMQKISEALRKLYEPTEELPSWLLALVEQIDKKPAISVGREPAARNEATPLTRF